jgi:hypothetical protein
MALVSAAVSSSGLWLLSIALALQAYLHVGSVVAADALIVGTWVKGKIVIGVGPAVGVREAVAALPPLEGRPAAVFCTCDVAPRGTIQTVADWLEEQGARALVGRSFRRKKSLRDVPVFVERALEAFTASLAEV